MRFTHHAAALVAASGVLAAQGSFTTSGTGCTNPTTCNANAIYEVLPAAGWDLDGQSITYAPAGGTWLAFSGGAFITPSMAATAIAPGDDVVRGPFPLGFTFNYPGGVGSTTMIDASSNGHIYLESGTITNSRCCSAGGALPSFMGDTPSIAVLGSDLAPHNGGTWTFDVQAVGPDTVALVTWTGVPEYPAVGANTVQGQLWSTGNVVICHVTTNALTSTDTALVGVSVGAQDDCGGTGIDYTTALPYSPTGPFGSGVPISLSATGSFAIGTTFTITANNLPPNAFGAALQFASAIAPMPLPLSLIGAPVGCDLQVDPIFFSGTMTTMAPTATLSVSTPNDPLSIGTTVQLQAFVSDLSQIGSFAIPVFVSDVGTLTLGAGLNDECATAITIIEGLHAGSTVGATTSSPTGNCGSMGLDVWYQYIPSCTGTATASLCATNGASVSFDSVLAAFSGTCGALTQIACNDDSCSLASQITFPVTAGTPYYIAVGEFGGNSTGTFTLFVGCQ